jgi:demethylmenaquinone methyltransferase / 2-methoxy-6-polyprenyl-1,4-benzoquinol methylase
LSNTTSTTPSASDSIEAKAVDKSGDRVKEMFAQIAPRYDLLNHLLSAGIDIRWRKKTVKRLRLDMNLPVLDCCTGTGDLALMLADRVEGKVEVIGCDFCPQMLEIADKKHLSRTSNHPVRFMEADAQELPFEDNAFQAVTVAFGLRNVQNTSRGLSEMIRVCAPGGQVAVLEFSQPEAIGFKQAYQFYFKKILPRLGQSIARNSHQAYEYLPNSVLQFPSGGDFVKLMESLSLKNVKWFPYTLGIASLYVGEKV